ncbi:sigma-54 dependent transcriptional regulator [Blastopirellula marina]|uniref:DNA-binding response regulator n=1 Tax=Blastopirellula marina TaxID=124 RepID=A0A2S8GNE1_9BACT|nr:sigma-54 dependent transcriptional regulator [Blastopirellula marina]PQO45963.1 DNA-binding response regulator [Blastopirellula marina]
MINSNPRILFGMAASEAARNILQQLSRMGCESRFTSDSSEFSAALGERDADLVILGTSFDYVAGLKLCRELTGKRPVVVLLSEEGSPSTTSVVEAVKLGAEDVIFPPYDPIRLHGLATIAKSNSDSASHRGFIAPNHTSVVDQQIDGFQSKPPSSERHAAIQQLKSVLVGDSKAMQHVRDLIISVADTAAAVMITGESGTGKELVARAIHQFSPRAAEPFVPVNMAAIPQSLAESLLFGHEKGAFTNAISAQPGWCASANEGTLFLDEIGEMELSLQPKLLRFLQEGVIHSVGAKQARQVDVRIITATNRPVESLVREKVLREDLFFRLHVVPIHLPPLRERREDIPALADLFLKRAAARHHRPVKRFSQDAVRELQRAAWPGNIRQLENLVERLVIFAKHEEIQTCDFPMDFHGDYMFTATANFFEESSMVGEANLSTDGKSRKLSMIEEKERAAILEALRRADGHVVTASQLLGMGQATLYRKIQKYAIPKWSRRKTWPAR